MFHLFELVYSLTRRSKSQVCSYLSISEKDIADTLATCTVSDACVNVHPELKDGLTIDFITSSENAAFYDNTLVLFRVDGEHVSIAPAPTLPGIAPAILVGVFDDEPEYQMFCWNVVLLFVLYGLIKRRDSKKTYDFYSFMIKPKSMKRMVRQLTKRLSDSDPSNPALTLDYLLSHFTNCECILTDDDDDDLRRGIGLRVMTSAPNPYGPSFTINYAGGVYL
jgi:hypothetical protein